MKINYGFCLLKKFNNCRAPVATVAILLAGFFSSCNQTPSKTKRALIWSQDFSLVGSLSSPRTADLNNDGVLDIVMGAGKNEFQKTDMGILAFDGKTGTLLWKQESIDQVFEATAFHQLLDNNMMFSLILLKRLAEFFLINTHFLEPE